MSIVSAFADAFNRRDMSALLDCFTERATYVDNFYGEHSGRASLQAMFERMFREGRDYTWAMDEAVESPTRAAAEWTFSYIVTDAVPKSAGRKVRFRGMSILETAPVNKASAMKLPRFERGLRPRNRVLGGGSEVGEAPSERSAGEAWAIDLSG